ncbi:MAG: hypothetical protein CO129_07680 [Ignavibacteriales bacterium CG_4_9_14_3_um_filter_34_10]|nr:MAG: hypothetical protein CO129_07680 [Ignavibacteriales bacterium CG_4_9_14_3_um_filter_34_10]
MYRIIFLLMIVFSQFVSGQKIDTKLTTDKSVYLIGDYIKLTFEVNYGKNVEVKLPAVKDSIKQLEYIKKGSTLKEEDNSGIHFKQTFIFSKYEPDTIEISSPPILFKIKGSTEYKKLSTNTVKLIINSYPVDNSKEIIDIKKPIEVQYNWGALILILFVIIVLFVASIYLWKKYKNKHQTETQAKIIKLPNYQVALNSLAELAEKKLWQNGKIKEYHSEITGIIRKYFEDEYGFKALEMTSYEIIEEMKTQKFIDKIIGLVDEFFANADLVKFAKFQPMASVNNLMMNQAYEIINQTKPIEIISSEVTNV